MRVQGVRRALLGGPSLAASMLGMRERSSSTCFMGEIFKRWRPIDNVLYTATLHTLPALYLSYIHHTPSALISLPSPGARRDACARVPPRAQRPQRSAQPHRPQLCRRVCRLDRRRRLRIVITHRTALASVLTSINSVFLVVLLIQTGFCNMKRLRLL